MNVPFSTEQFFEVFAAYNQAVWPMQIIFNVATLLIIALVFFPNRFSNHIITILLSFLWLWMGFMYHIRFFSAINKAAWGFGILFILQGLLFTYYGQIKQLLVFKIKEGMMTVAGYIIILYALLAYPVMAIFLGHWYPSTPTFGLPCPTTMFTLGLLLLTDKKVPIPVIIIPLLWSVIGFAAAIKFGMWEDTGLLISAIMVGYFLIHQCRTKVIDQ